jgi:hypothetical protein
MTVGDLIKDKDYDYIEYRLTLPPRLSGDIFAGVCRSENGKLISLDGDTYSEDEEVVRWEEWSNPEKDIMNGLTVVVEGVYV